MINKHIISYEDIKQFLIGKKEIDVIYRMSEQYPAYGLFITIQKLGSPLINYSENREFTFDDAENFLQDYLAGALNVKGATDILNSIVASEQNFEKLIYKINENIKAVEETSLYNKVFEPQKDNSEIIAGIKKLKISQMIPIGTFLNNPKRMYTILAAAAILLVLLLLPLQFQNELADSYNFDNIVPVDYLDSRMRDSDSAQNNKTDGSNDFENHFMQGMADYLAYDYKSAIQEWQGLENKLKKSGVSREFAEQFYLYYAVSPLALSLSKNQDISAAEKNELYKHSLALFDNLSINSDVERYYYALCLALNKQEERALENLSLIDTSSPFYARKEILKEQLVH